MKARLGVIILLGILLGGRVSAHEQLPPETLTLDGALERVEFHSDYQAWLNSVSGVEDSIQAIKDKYALSLDLSGNLLSYTYNLATENNSISTGAGLSLAKSSLKGTTLSGNLAPNYSVTKSELSTKWSIELRQVIWPAPRLGGDQISLVSAEQTYDVLEEQFAYMIKNAQLKIEDLYRTAQFRLAQVAFAEKSVENARLAVQIITQKEALGEASETDLISGELGVLRAERELESSLKSAQTAQDALFTALDLEGDYQLSILDVGSVDPGDLDRELELEKFQLEPESHPLLLSYEYELQKALLNLEAARESYKPEASLRISLAENNQRQKEFTAAVSIAYPLLDRNHRQSTVKERQDSLDTVLESRAKALRDVERLIEEAELELTRLERDRRIAGLTLRQAQLEWEAALQRHQAGIIDQSSLSDTRLALQQAQLNYLEGCFRHDLARRRLSYGIVGDLAYLGGISR